jgi:hypothetical protein
MKENYLFQKEKYTNRAAAAYMRIDAGRYEIAPSYTNRLFQENKLAYHIIETIYRCDSNNSLDTTDEIFKDRLNLIRSKIELILLQLDQRKKINQNILYQIQKDSCEVQNLYFNMGERSYEITPDRLRIEQMKFDLERQKRLEQANYFKDTGLLNKDLKDTLIQYMDEVQKSSIVTEEDVI